MGNSAKFLKQNSNVTALVWTNEDDEEKTIKITLPIKMNFKVLEAPPAVRGDTSKGGNKVITLENGTTLNAPMFVSEGDTVSINTENGEYVERVQFYFTTKGSKPKNRACLMAAAKAR